MGGWEIAPIGCVFISAEIQHISLEEKPLMLGLKYSDSTLNLSF